MTVKLDFEECLKDSPRFRAAIEDVQTDVSELETRLDKLVKQCQAMLDAGRAYCQHSKSFFNGLRELGHQCSRDKMMEEMIETTQKSVKTKLQNFVKEDVRRFTDVRKKFERSSEILEGALARNAQAPRGKQHEVEEASNALLNARRSFRCEALDYVLQINVIEAKKKTDIVMAMLVLMDAQAQFFQQSHESLSELDEYRQKLSEEHTQFVLDSAREKRDMEQKHAAVKTKDVSYDDSIMDFNADSANGIAMEGYLYKRASNAFKTWSRRWFSIQKNQLVYQKKFKEQPTVVVEDLRLCTVKTSSENERRFFLHACTISCLCADSERQQQGWISAVQNSIASAFQERREDTQSPVRSIMRSGGSGGCVDQENNDCQALEDIQAIPGNRQCCDCGEPSPDWASINLGITLCIVCSGIHRSLGVHFSKVRSLTLDSWEPELIKLMCELGNNVINRIYEARIDEITIKKPNPASPRGDKESWIRSKYVEKKFIQKLPETGRNPQLTRSNRAATLTQKPPLKPKPSRTLLPRKSGTSQDIKQEEEEDLSGLHPGALLYRSAALQNFPLMADALAHGADVNWVNPSEESSTPMIQAVLVNALAACEFLLQNGANVNQADSNGRGPLHHATILGHTGLVCLFLKRGADYNARDKNQKDPLSIAVDNANADIVTLLRITKMNKEMREMDGAFGQSGDETYQDIFRDFSHMASNNPEKLRRRSMDPKS
uniref:Arf-GAP with coiled-coil, ANK repeat and PH domain-containing protein n=1 Tax=Oryzias latipes TaxID=8090 RepID=H2LQU0_ORYLA